MWGGRAGRVMWVKIRPKKTAGLDRLLPFASSHLGAMRGLAFLCQARFDAVGYGLWGWGSGSKGSRLMDGCFLA